ncbi:hypothetical protein MicvaDRAFT_2948 [Microcoleus vaginatus FGP-2]|nr:hypothetical protein MicvaDRAFT_2948 [Microcoleus vaginatus FGP-2]
MVNLEAMTRRRAAPALLIEDLRKKAIFRLFVGVRCAEAHPTKANLCVNPVIKTAEYPSGKFLSVKQ